jgi:hypothetical protein
MFSARLYLCLVKHHFSVRRYGTRISARGMAGQSQLLVFTKTPLSEKRRLYYVAATRARKWQPKLKQISEAAIQPARRQRLTATNQNQPSSPKKPRTIVPPPQSARIMQRYVGGQSIRQIARDEKRDRATVTKIVRSDEMQGFVQKMRERLYGFAFDAMNAVEHSLKQQNDARLAYRMLCDIGIVPSPGERYSIAAQSPSIDKSTMTPLELAMAEDEDGRISRVAYGAACVMEESARAFGTELPTAQEYRRGCRVAKIADEITNGRFTHIPDGAEEKRVRKSAEEIVKREDARKSLPAHRAPQKLRQKKQRTLAS